jgi:F-type H+-transporting ATPase subunit epsilon
MAMVTLKIITPRRIVFEDQIDLAVVQGVQGDLGVLPRHTPLVTLLKAGIARIKKDGSTYAVAISGGGFLEVTPDVAIILTESAELPEEIDVARAREARRRAEERLASETPDIDFARAKAALCRARVRLELAGQREKQSQRRPFDP